jgi:hypothetical protein
MEQWWLSVCGHVIKSYWEKNLFIVLDYQKILDSKGAQTLKGKKSQTKQKKFMKVEDGNVNHTRYYGHLKQSIRIPKAT